MSDPKLAAAERKATEMALALIHERHESGHIVDRMHYHNRAHTVGVIERAKAIGAAMGMSERELLLTAVAAAFHDTVQRWSAVEHNGGVIMRQRKAGRDEVASAYEASEALAELGLSFTSIEQGIVASAIVATIPGWDADASSVSQPFLVDHSVIRAVALADIGAAGMDPDMFLRDGPALFAEENLDLMQAITAARRMDEIAPSTRESYRTRYLAWLKFQPQFARGRQKLMIGEVGGLDEERRRRVEALFCHFDESIAASEAASAGAVALDFVALMRQLAPAAFPDES